MMNRYKITVELVEVGGGWSLSTLIGGNSSGYRLQRSYYGYTKREALAMFRQYVKEQTQ
jgi:hypothetical protein